MVLTGGRFTTAGPSWWSAPLAIVGAWIGVRLTLETAESRGTLLHVIVAAACYAVAAAAAWDGLSPGSECGAKRRSSLSQ